MVMQDSCLGQNELANRWRSSCKMETGTGDKGQGTPYAFDII